MSKKNDRKATAKAATAKSTDVKQEAAPAVDTKATDASAATASQEPAAPVTATTATREQVPGAVVAPKSLKIEKDRPMQNGVKRPSAGGLCRAVWDALDKLYDGGKGELPTAAHAKQLAVANSWNLNNASIELCQWRKFNGLNKPRKAATAEA